MYNAQNHLHESSKVRGLDMGQDYTGANYFDGGSVASFGDPQLTTSIDYKEQNMGQNMLTDVSGKTVEAARNADLEILNASQKAEKANEYARMAKAYQMEKPGMDSSNVRKLADPEVAKQTFQDVNVINQQSRQSRMFA